jgi:hypothetical protein
MASLPDFYNFVLEVVDGNNADSRQNEVKWLKIAIVLSKYIINITKSRESTKCGKM